MQNVLLGGLITLAVTCLVQIIIVPWVQTRNRRRERWEKDVTELLTLLEVDLPRLIREADRAIPPLEALPMRIRMDPARPPEVIAAEAEATSAYDALKDAANRGVWLGYRVARLRPRSPVWRELLARLVGAFNNTHWAAPRRMSKTPGEKSYLEAARIEVLRAHTLLVDVAHTMEPPGAGRLRRLLERRGILPKPISLQRFDIPSELETPVNMRPDEAAVRLETRANEGH